MILIGRGLDLKAGVDVLSGHLPVRFSRCDRLSWQESRQAACVPSGMAGACEARAGKRREEAGKERADKRSEPKGKRNRRRAKRSRRAEKLKSQQDREHKISGDNSLRDPPVPIPNTEVKPQHADGTWLETARESRSSPDSILRTFD